MTDLVVITPSRGRPQALNELAWAVGQTTDSRVKVLALVDDDDPQRDNYQRIERTFGMPGTLTIQYGPRDTLTGWTNKAATQLLKDSDPPRYLASLGDDHRPRTPNWDRRLIEAIEGIGGSGIAYGNDLMHGQNLPTSWVVSADIVQAVGWMMLPTCDHLFVDNAVLELGRAAGRIAYRPDVVIEHLHPLAGKGKWDSSYQESNAPGRYDADGTAFAAWKATGLAADVEKIRQAVRA
jgi:hypothetical protein